jgi:hypothetical protein
MYAALPLLCHMMSTAQPFISLHNKTREGRLVYFVEAARIGFLDI